MKQRISILELADTDTGETREVLRSAGNTEAPFFRGRGSLNMNSFPGSRTLAYVRYDFIGE